MPTDKPFILCTGPLDRSGFEPSWENVATIEVIPFTDVSHEVPDQTRQLVDGIAGKKANVVFTSANAIRSVVRMLENRIPDWSIFCLGNNTRRTAARYFGESSIKLSGNNATDLANQITGVEEVCFFCGNLRRFELPAILRKRGIGVSEIIVYTTTATPVVLEKLYDAILFFNPAAVESFFCSNAVAGKTILFTIGKTTATTLQLYTNNTIIVGEAPDKIELLKKAIGYFESAGISK